MNTSQKVKQMNRARRWCEYVRWCMEHEKDFIGIEEWTEAWNAGLIR